ncbi:PP2C family protein-serine/threonine phosphatase [Candidatus Magnetaquicoccus inordinatus]|uniref:PP2C family protein-serine/threonine phosphatase n=1 Tax=Candidatus Magnetaquicoccus inordinatus TaxID=2496818 RepID=UPI00102AF50B|nr:SpoIIE family protein phosphatase [Candidatus Magnetaquicoccus inordinatus]
MKSLDGGLATDLSAESMEYLYSEERTIAQAEALLQEAEVTGKRWQDAFTGLLKDYKRLNRQLDRLNRINDRNQLLLRRQHAKLAADQSIIEKILTKMRAGVQFDEHAMRHLLMPLDNMAGDLLFSMRRPDGVRHILLGDITGHGLPAAIVGPEVSNIFHTMTRKGYAAGVILAEINQNLRDRLPTGIYLAATMLEWDEGNHLVQAWNGGLPEGLLFRQGRLWERLPSAGFPLGIVSNTMQNWTRQILQLQPGDRVILFSDGIIEGSNDAGESFGMERLCDCLQQMYALQEPLHRVVDRARQHIGGQGRFEDDITIVELTV